MSKNNRHIPEPERKEERLACLLAVGLILLNYPLLSIFGGRDFFLGIPSLYFYLFAAWALLIVVTALVQGTRPRHGLTPEDTANTEEP